MLKQKNLSLKIIENTANLIFLKNAYHKIIRMDQNEKLKNKYNLSIKIIENQ